jgi:predicted HAD superfamily Cof-like phosphohydrolase
MTNPFRDQARFMRACNQPTGAWNEDQFNLYTRLIQEETDELWAANAAANPTECLDALIDIMVVTIGAIHSLGVDGEGAWAEVMRSNLDKIDPITGFVKKREDGKVLKPEGWKPPELDQFIQTR